jgi:hypothetical protein
VSVQNDLKTSKDELRTVATLTSGALSQFAKLFQNEVDLAKAEVSEKFSRIGNAMAYIGAGAILVIPALGDGVICACCRNDRGRVVGTDFLLDSGGHCRRNCRHLVFSGLQTTLRP